MFKKQRLFTAVFFSYECHEAATKQRLHPQSVAEIICHSVLSGTGFDNVRHRLGLATRTQISVCKSPFPYAGTAVSLFRAKTVQQRPLLPRKVDIIITHTVRLLSDLTATYLALILFVNNNRMNYMQENTT